MRDAAVFLIDPPSPFSPRADWVAFLAEMEELLREHPGSKDIEDSIKQAKAELSA
jgi:hypothetical protein